MMIAEYSDKIFHPDPLSDWLPLGRLGRGVPKRRRSRRRGEGIGLIEEKHKKCHYNLQTSIGPNTQVQNL
jgi:hypothetical protein